MLYLVLSTLTLMPAKIKLSYRLLLGADYADFCLVLSILLGYRLSLNHSEAGIQHQVKKLHILNLVSRDFLLPKT